MMDMSMALVLGITLWTRAVRGMRMDLMTSTLIHTLTISSRVLVSHRYKLESMCRSIVLENIL